MNTAETFADRVLQRIAALGTTEHAVSRAVAGTQYLVRDIKKRGSIPRGDRLNRLADELQTTVDWLLYGTGNAATVASPARTFAAETPAIIGQTFAPQPAPHGPGRDFPKNVPVLGNALGSSTDFSNGTPGPMELIEMGATVDMVRRPPGLAQVKTAYALYIMGDSQSPRFEPGELIYINPHRPAAPGDDVVVQLVDDDGCTNCALVKRLVRRTPDALILRQFNPPHDFTVPLTRVKPGGIHRVMTFAELYGY